MSPNQPCCQDFEKAKETGTDNEGWGSLLQKDDPGDRAWRIGLELPAIRYCPWCGRKLEPGSQTFTS